LKLAVQQTLIPGADIKERFQRVAEFAFDGVELAVWGFDGPLDDYFDEIDSARQSSGIAISSICTSSADDLVHPEAAEREKRLAGLVRNLRLADALGAGGVIALPIRPPARLPDLSPVADETSLITQLLTSSLRSALDQTASGQAAIFLEPLNRYEARYLRTIGHAAKLCEAVGSPRVKIMADLFHMNIEEANPGRALKEVGTYVGHVHLADSQRLEPGKGHLDFVSAFRSLHEIGFDGWCALECGLSGVANEVLPAAVRFIRDQAQS
jgi:sugar phosphate isomerase/epimerase